MHSSPSRLVLAAVLAVSALVAASRRAMADTVVRDLRFRADVSTAAQASPARFAGAVRAVDVLFEARGAGADSLRVTVRAPGGLLVLTQEVAIASETWQGHAVNLRGERVCLSLAEGMRDAWSGLRSDADRLAKARAGHQEYLMQVQSRAVTLRSQVNLLLRLSWPEPVSDRVAALLGHLERVEALLADARALPASDLEALKKLAQDMVGVADAAATDARAVATPDACGSNMPLPMSDDGAYDVSLSQDGFPALSGEFWIGTPRRLYLPLLATW